jgi:hypothetical protein
MAEPEALAERRASVTWIDTPLSGVARDISSKFGIDAIFHPEILSDEPLIHLELSEASFDMIRAALHEQLKARTALIDGALWAVPAGIELDEPTTRPSFVSPASEEDAHPPGPLDQFVILVRSVRSWQVCCDRLSRATGVVCRVVPREGPFTSPLDARGTVGEVLESAQLLGCLAWRLTPGGGDRPSALEIRPGPRKP